ncbi:hypothetical protein PP178_04245 [Zeaxanthinibacter sp. PT1]|uniref:hypothetical protein n=1 Tax=Zeaxanthinibacter TaxID=561554 RepID=UPI00234BB176|nr:hypothetical protein [Zeaxanthinibacter sp. PT1]MDC6350750.1 hypothetical protein [Zeaxanthinibacter sp. PT1]
MQVTFYKPSTSGKSAWCGVKESKWTNDQAKLVVIPIDPIREVLGREPEAKDTFEVPDNLEVSELYIWDEELGERVQAFMSKEDGKTPDPTKPMYTLTVKQ